MITVRPPVVLSGAMPSASLLLGQAASAEVIQEIQSSVGATFIGGRFDPYENEFIQNIVMPARRAAEQLRHTAVALRLVDDFIPIATFEELASVPPCMQLPLVMYPPVRKLLEEGRIDGYGYDPSLLPEEDVYGRLVNNGVIEDLHLLERDEDNYITAYAEWTWLSDDPVLEVHEIDLIDRMRQTCALFMELTENDPTNPSQVIG